MSPLPPRRLPFLARYLLLVLLLLAFLPGCASSSLAEEEDGPGIRILFVGNSLTFANDLPGMLEELLVRAGVEVGRIAAVALPNYGLQDHWARGIAQGVIAEGDWDIVALQQGPSATEGRPSLLEYSQLFAQEISAVGGRPALYMVWPAADRAFDFDGVSDSYRTAAEQVDGLLFPAGEAWRAAWRRDETVALYGPDGFHPSVLGTYLAALVIFDQVTTQALVNPTSIPTSSGQVTIPAALADLLQEAAQEANTQFAR